MNKINGKKLKTELNFINKKISNIHYNINKKFNLILQHPKYISDEYKIFIENNSIYDMDINTKLKIIIDT